MQGFNMGRYVPPDLEGTTSGNKLHQKRAPGTLRKDGTQTVRFEMPFAVWCHHCKPHAIIGQGVRFNAEKTKVGKYYTTPIWSFKLKHAACGGAIEIQTDPKNTTYVVVDGGKARDYGDDKVREGEGGVPILTAEERERRRENAFARLEGQVEEKEAVKDNAKRIEELYRVRDKDWDDPWSANKRLRSTFRAERKAHQREEKATEALKERIGTDMDLLPGTEQDAQRAKLISFGDSSNHSRDAASAWPVFHKTPGRVLSKSVKPGKGAHKEALQRQLVNNTRAAMNPFG
ncbi:DUF455 domain protein [Acrodontium crateriforme]|uniref:DUF455 domain protein n=1 Tax=Acrodontium crateriforme TaxID=150365 RepID=A0AAQ3R966_9PEZI|nr:DUF455 domain protein [Acrodontium crateriforme]